MTPQHASTHRPRERRGYALAVALMAIAVIGAMVAGGYLSDVQEYRMGRNTLVQQRAMSATEFGLDTVYSGWSKSWNSVKAGSTIVLAYKAADGSWVDTVRLTKLNMLSLLAVSEGRAGTSRTGQSARRRAGMLLRLNMPRYNQPGALTSRGNVTISGNTALWGRDTVPPGWDCPPAGAATAGVEVPSLANVTFQGKNCKGPTYACISGTPLLDSTVAADTNTYFNYGNQTWSDLVAQATISGVSGTLTSIQPSKNPDGSCNTSDVNNWGDPGRAVASGAAPGPCESYFPIVYAPGNLIINGKMGQGILLVAGSLAIQGNFTWSGQIITRGTIKLTGTGTHILGGVLAAAVVDSSSGSLTSGNNTIQYSRCTLNSVFANTSWPKRAAQRSWAELF